MYATFVFFCAMSTANNEFIRNTIPMMLVFVFGLDVIVTAPSAKKLRAGKHYVGTHPILTPTGLTEDTSVHR